MIKPSIFQYRIGLAVVSLIALFVSFYLQYGLGLHPCPLCLMQRACAFLLVFFCLIGLFFYSKKKSNRLNGFQMILSCAGFYFSVRQLWLLSLPVDQVPACMPGLDVLIEYFPWQTVVKALFLGAGDCAEATWHLLGVPLPGWSAMYFVLMALGHMALLYHK